MTSFMFIITSDSVSVADCAAAVEQVAKEQRASLDLVYLMSAIVSKKPNSAEEVMRAQEQLKRVFEQFPESKGWVMDFIDDENKNIPNYMTTLLRS